MEDRWRSRSIKKEKETYVNKSGDYPKRSNGSKKEVLYIKGKGTKTEWLRDSTMDLDEDWIKLSDIVRYKKRRKKHLLEIDK